MKGLTFVRCGPLGTSLRAHSGEVPVGLISPHARRGGVAVWELYFTGSRSGAEVGSACDMEAAKIALEDAWVRFLDRAGLIPIDGRIVRHKRRGSIYRVVGDGTAQCDKPIRDGDTVAIYRHRTEGRLWVRPPAEFDDGRFEQIGGGA